LSEKIATCRLRAKGVGLDGRNLTIRKKIGFRVEEYYYV